jgi:hypothetical protein
MYSTLVLVAGSAQMPGLGMSAFGAASFTPIEMALMLFRTRPGTSARVVPGTSRSESTVGRGTPSSSARSRASLKEKSITSELMACSYSMLKAPAWK